MYINIDIDIDIDIIYTNCECLLYQCQKTLFLYFFVYTLLHPTSYTLSFVKKKI